MYIVSFSSYPVSGVDFSINQFVRNLGLEHLIDIFEREQVSGYFVSRYSGLESNAINSDWLI